jgi:hypothetical protein
MKKSGSTNEKSADSLVDYPALTKLLAQKPSKKQTPARVKLMPPVSRQAHSLPACPPQCWLDVWLLRISTHLLHPTDGVDFFFETTFSRTFKKKKYLSAKILDQFLFEYHFHLGLGGGWRCPEMSSGHQE